MKKDSKTITGALNLRRKTQGLLDRERFLSTFNELQKKWILNWTDRFQLFFGGRRGGKSVGNTGKIIYCDFFHKPDVKSFIIIMCSTKDHAKELYWNKLKAFNFRFNAGWIFKEKDSKIITGRNEILFIGLVDWRSTFRKLGMPAKLIVIDEAQELPNGPLEVFLNDVASFSTFDHDGIVVLTGNPTRTHTGVVYKYWTQAKDLGFYKLSTNIFLNDAFDKLKIEEFLDQERRRRGLKKGNEDAAFKRMALGEWVVDSDVIVFRPSPDNFFKKIPTGNFIRIMGVDFGWHHKDAFVILAHEIGSREIYLEYEFQRSKMNLDEAGEKINELAKMYNCRTAVYDSGGLGKKMGETLDYRYSDINLIAGKNDKKMLLIDILRTEIANRNFKIRENGIFHKECDHILYEPDHQKLDEKNGIHSDILPAIYYAMDYINNYLESEVIMKADKYPKISAKEYAIEQAKKKMDPDYESPFDDVIVSNDQLMF